FGMVISVSILWWFKDLVERPKEAARPAGEQAAAPTRSNPIDSIPDAQRVGVLIVVFLIVIVFWMVFHQNSTTMTYWADENTAWQVSGIISSAINAFWVIVLALPLAWFWRWLDRRGLEPSTPAKMALGMVMTSAAFAILYVGARIGEARIWPGEGPYEFLVSPAWLIGAYAVLTLGELMLSPMGLTLVSKVAPVRLRGVMMGGWFVATAIGNKLTVIAVYWTEWLHSSFWAVCSGLALAMAVVVFVLLRPLKKAMPGV